MWFTDTEEALASKPSSLQFAIGLDEAGRGCMAGPVFTSAVLVRVSKGKMPFAVSDSKMLNEHQRNEGLSAFCAATGITDEASWRRAVLSGIPVHRHPQLLDSCTRIVAVSVRFTSSEQIDRINISNASLEGMAAACHDVVEAAKAAGLAISHENTAVYIDGKVLPWTFLSDAAQAKVSNKKKRKRADDQRIGTNYPDLSSLAAQAVVKGDQKLWSVACASVLSKVLRDQYCVDVMHVSDPGYDFGVHKGYCTAHHKALLHRLGLSVYHRRSYAPVASLVDGASRE